MGAAVWYNTGGTGPKATVTIHRDGSAEVEHGVQDLGTGSRTMVAIVAAEELGLPLDRVSVAIGDTRPALRPRLRRLDDDALERADDPARGLPGEAQARRGARPRVEGPPPIGDRSPAAASRLREIRRTKISWKEACAKLPEEGVSATAERAENHDDAWKRFTAGAQFAEVEVDIETGQVRVKQVVAVHDCGLVVNALTAESQIQGGVIQGISYALYENRVLDRQTGRMVNPNVEQYKIAGALDVPEIDVTFVPVWDGVNNTHSVGIGEPSTVPTAAAIANAVSHAIGARIRACRSRRSRCSRPSRARKRQGGRA